MSRMRRNTSRPLIFGQREVDRDEVGEIQRGRSEHGVTRGRRANLESFAVQIPHRASTTVGSSSTTRIHDFGHRTIVRPLPTTPRAHLRS